MFDFDIRATELVKEVAGAATVAAGVGAGILRGVGIDIVDLRAFERQIAVAGDRFLSKLLTPNEIEHCEGRLERLATRVAAKEAAVKALGTGFRGVSWKEIEVVTASNGAPSLRLSGAAAAIARKAELHSLVLSCSHEDSFAVAIVVSESRDESALAPRPSIERR